jgi:diacylglycerol kinase (ATP)
MLKHTVKNSGLARIIAAFRYSVSGFREALAHEAAFRQEVFLYIIFLPALYYLPVPSTYKALLLFANTLIITVELLNSAIEAIVDLASPEFHDLAKRAKDMGSAAVMTSVFLALLLWGNAIFIVINQY